METDAISDPLNFPILMTSERNLPDEEFKCYIALDEWRKD
jgi:hypothetical protein